MFSNRRPYYGLKLSISDLFREPVRYIKQSNTQESMMEKPYLVDEYPKMHLNLPDFKHKPRKRAGFLGNIASGTPYGGLAIIDYGDAKCWWDITRTSYCIDGPIVITMIADYFWSQEFTFEAGIVNDSIGNVVLSQLPVSKAGAWDEQDYLLTFPEDANGSVTVCGFASTNSLVSQTFETVVAGQPVGIRKFGGSLIPVEHGRAMPAVLEKSSYGTKGANCGCIDFSTSCDSCVGVIPATWDDGASADVIARSASVSVSVKDGPGSYNWSVSGTGFTLNFAVGGNSNTLNADASACGVATITVTDACGGNVTGYVRCTTGQWVFSSNTCPIPGVATSGVWERTFGEDRVIVGLGGKWWHNYGDDLDCTTKCGAFAYGCNECITSITCPDWHVAYVDCKTYECIQIACSAGNYGYCVGLTKQDHYKWEC